MSYSWCASNCSIRRVLRPSLRLSRERSQCECHRKHGQRSRTLPRRIGLATAEQHAKLKENAAQLNKTLQAKLAAAKGEAKHNASELEKRKARIDSLRQSLADVEARLQCEQARRIDSYTRALA